MSPDKVGRYKIKSELGRGGMATVYRAYDPSFDREVAVKVLPREMVHNLVFRARFKRELKLIASLEHPAIVPVYDVGEEEDGRQYFVMRYMGGDSLSDWIKREALSLQDTAIIIERLASALDYAHTKGIVHRDIKPDNVLFDETNHPYLTDFGIAKLTESAVSATGGGTMGTPAYVSPEQAQGAKVDSRADIYGMGVMIYEMLTGNKPYDADSPMSVAVRHITEPIPDILQDRPDLPIDVDTVIRTAMAKDKEDRYATAVDLARALSRAAFGEDRTTPVNSTLLNKPNKSSNSRRRTLIIAGMGVLIALATAFVLSRQLPALPAVDMTPTTRVTAIPPTLTFTPAPTSTATAMAIQTEEVVTAVPPPGNADKIAFISGNQIYLMNIDGTDLIQILTDNSAKSNLHWMSDGRLVYVSRNCANIIDVETRDIQELVCFDPNETLEDFRVSPDGKWMAISIQRTLNILPFDPDLLKGVETRFGLTLLRENCFYNQYAFRDMLWSKSGAQLAARVVDTERVSSDQIFLLTVDIPNCDTIGPVRIDRIPGSHIDFDSASTKRITSFDWNGANLFLLNDSIRNNGFGDLYFYDSQTKVSKKINPIDGVCCYRDARWSPDSKYIIFVFQRFDSNEVGLYYVEYSDVENGEPLTPIELPSEFLTQRDKPQPVLRPAQ
ncbi:MAG: serine/threonine-protein kinase [Anaerolineae bacterium]|nr:serine/threonine-protein kinase [Anaerolineae bacterium]